MRLFNYGYVIGAALPFGWCLHFYRGANHDAFLRRLADARIGHGIDWKFCGRRLLLWKTPDYGSHNALVEALYKAEEERDGRR